MESINLHWQYIPTEIERENFAKIKDYIGKAVKFSVVIFAIILLAEAEWEYKSIDKNVTYAFGAFYLFAIIIWSKVIDPQIVLHDYKIAIDNIGIIIDEIDTDKHKVFEWENIKSWSKDKSFYFSQQQQSQIPVAQIKPNELYIGTKTFQGYFTLRAAPAIREQIMNILRNKKIKELKRDKSKLLTFHKGKIMFNIKNK